MIFIYISIYIYEGYTTYNSGALHRKRKVLLYIYNTQNIYIYISDERNYTHILYVEDYSENNIVKENIYIYIYKYIIYIYCIEHYLSGVEKNFKAVFMFTKLH